MLAMGCCSFFGVNLAMSWWLEMEVRPLQIGGTFLWLLAVWGVVLRRRRTKERNPDDPHFRWYRFSLFEIFIVATGGILFFGLNTADYRQRLELHYEQVRLQTAAEDILGPDGSLGFGGDGPGTLSLTICDRSFDDQRLMKLMDLIQDHLETNRIAITGIMFGTSALTTGTPPEWPGITDASLDMILGWQELKTLSVYGTGITIEGQKRLLKLPDLEEWVRTMISRRVGNEP